MDAPYIGLRPYMESERELLYGRDDDAARLINRIFSNQLTLLYAASGVGKTSLIRSLIIPLIRAQDARPIYFDAWAGPNPLASLKRTCFPDGRSSTESLATTFKKDSFDGDTVLILDQFEIFLIQHASELDLVRRELGELVQTASSVRVLISLREEFLAALNSFRTYLPNIYNSQHRLERLRGSAARDAISRPAEKWNKSVEATLVDQLLVDLRAEVSPDTDPQSALQPEGIEAPFLQLVCRHLWFDADRKKMGELGIELYREAGGKDAIVRAYIKDVTDSFVGQTAIDAATILRVLAPPSGVKNSLSISDIQSLTSLTPARIRPILTALANRIVLRTRQPISAQGDLRYELYHDAFTRVLRPWIDEVLFRSMVKRMIMRGAIALIAGIVVLGTIWTETFRIYKERAVAIERDRVQTADRIQLLKDKGTANAREILGSLSLYLLDQGNPDSLARLEKLLKEADQDQLITFDHGMDRSVTEADKDVESPLSAPLTLAVSQRVFGGDQSAGFLAAKDRLMQAWRKSAPNIAHNLGFLIPDQLNVVPDATLPEGEAKVIALAPLDSSEAGRPATGSHVARISMNPSAAGAVLVTNEDLQRLASFILERAPESDCLPSKSGKAWVYVPRWSLPVWQIMSEERRSLEALLVCSLANIVQSDLDLVVTWPSLLTLSNGGTPLSQLLAWNRDKFGLEPVGHEIISSIRQRTFHGLAPLLDELTSRSQRQQTEAAHADAQDESAALMRSKRSRDPTIDDFPDLDRFYSANIRSLLRDDVVVRIPTAVLKDKQYSDRVDGVLSNTRLSNFEKTGLIGPAMVVEPSSEPRISMMMGKSEEYLPKDATPEQIGNSVARLLAKKTDVLLDDIIRELRSVRLNAANADFIDAAQILRAYVRSRLNKGEPYLATADLDWLVGSLPFWMIIARDSDTLDYYTKVAKQLQLLTTKDESYLDRPISSISFSGAVEAAANQLSNYLQLPELSPIPRLSPEIGRRLQAIQSPDRETAAKLFAYYYRQFRPSKRANFCSVRNLTSLNSVGLQNLPELRHLLEIKSLIDEGGSYPSWAQLACKLEFLTKGQQEEPRVFFQSIVNNANYSSIDFDLPQISRFLLQSSRSFGRTVEYERSIRPLFDYLTNTVARSSTPENLPNGLLKQADLRQFCANNRYLSGCWNLLTAIAENAGMPATERFHAALLISRAWRFDWAPDDQLIDRAQAVLIALQKDGGENSKTPAIALMDSGGNAIEPFELKLSMDESYVRKAVDGTNKDALLCLERLNQLRKEQPKVFSQNSTAVDSLAQCLQWGGKPSEARKILESAVNASDDNTTVLNHLDQLADVYLEEDDAKGLTKLLDVVDRRLPIDIFDQKHAYLFSWNLARLLDPKQDLTEMIQPILADFKQTASPFEKLALYWRLVLADRNEEAAFVIDEFRQGNVLEEKLESADHGRLLSYADWPELLVRALVTRSPRLIEFEQELLAQNGESSGPSKFARGPAALSRLADFYFYRALMNSTLAPREQRERVLQSGLIKVIDNNFRGATEYNAARALLKRPNIVPQFLQMKVSGK